MLGTASSPPDIENGDGIDDQPNRSESAMSQLSQASQEVDYGDSSWPIYSMYCKIAQQDDNMITERCRKDTTGTLVFTGLFAVTVGSLLTVSIPDLKPNSQDVSAFYLENIYQLFAASNVSQATIPFTLAKPPPFSPPNYAIWVNSLWFLSLAINLTGATIATLGQQWAHRYISVTQHPRYTPDQRARIRAILAKNALGAYAIWGSGLSPFFLHSSLFLFLAGGLIYLFNLSSAAFGAVVWWIAIAVGGYAIVTVDSILKPENLFYTPFSPSTLRLYLGLSSMVFRVCAYIKPLSRLCDDARERYRDLGDRYRYGLVVGKWMRIEEKASDASSEIDGIVIEQTLRALDDDDALGRFFDAIPGFFKSRSLEVPFPTIQTKIGQALYGYLERTFASNSLSDSVKSDRLITSLNAAHAALGPEAPSKIILIPLWSRVPQSIEMGYALSRWCIGHAELNVEPMRWIVARILASVRERDDRWRALAMDVFGLPERALLGDIGHDDSVLLSILIHITRQAIRSGSWTPWMLSSHPKFNIRDTLPALQNDFCALWNEIVLQARDNDALIDTLRNIRHSYIALHEGTDAAPAAFSSSTDDYDRILFQLSSYSLCNIDSHSSYSAAPLTISPTVLHGHSHDALLQPAPLETHALSVNLLDVAATSAIRDNTDTSILSSTAGIVRRSTSGGGFIPKRVQEAVTTPSFIGSDALPASSTTPSPGHDAIAVMHPSYVHSTVSQTEHTSHTSGTPTLSPAIDPLSFPPHVTMVLDQYSTIGTGFAGTRDDDRDPNLPPSTWAFHDLG